MFVINNKEYGASDPENSLSVFDEQRFTLQKVAPVATLKFTYEYDFGDSWRHEIVVEENCSS